jgi:hypothetical protein
MKERADIFGMPSSLPSETVCLSCWLIPARKEIDFDTNQTGIYHAKKKVITPRN